jgi:hypothetical protein
MKTEYEIENEELKWSDNDEEEEDEQDVEEEFQLDGYFTISSYHEGYEPFSEIWQNYFFTEEHKPILIKPVTSIKSVDTSVRCLTDVFDRLKSMTVFKIPKNFNLRQTGLSQPRKTRSKLCRSLLQNLNCEFGSNCKFAHKFDLLQKCKFDHCKKTQLVGPGLFKTPFDENICPLRHNFESLDSFILRTREKTTLKMNINIFKNNIDDLKNILHFVKDCVVQLTVV